MELSKEKKGGKKNSDSKLASVHLMGADVFQDNEPGYHVSSRGVKDPNHQPHILLTY